MKKVLLSLIAAASVAMVHAQSHTLLVYGDVSINSNSQDYGFKTLHNTTLGINPGIGYQFNDHWTIGVQGGYSYSKVPAPGSLSTYLINNDWGAGAFLRFSYNLGKVFFMYDQLNLGAIGGDSKYDGSSLKGTYSGFSGEYFPAIGARFCKGWAINLNTGGLAYNTVNWTHNFNGLHSESNFTFNFGRVLNIGISKNFGMHRHHHGHMAPNAEFRRMDTGDEDDEDDSATPTPPPAKHHYHHHKHHHQHHQSDDDED